MSRITRLIAVALIAGACSLIYSDKTAAPPVDTNTDPLKGVRITPGAKKPAASKPATARPGGASALGRAAAPKTASNQETLMRAMRDELARSKQLGLASLDQPYFIEYSADEVQN